MKYVILVGCDNPVHAKLLSHANGTTQVFAVRSDADETLEKIKKKQPKIDKLPPQTEKRQPKTKIKRGRPKPPTPPPSSSEESESEEGTTTDWFGHGARQPALTPKTMYELSKASKTRWN